MSSMFGRVVRESPRKRKLATYGEAEVTSILFAEEEEVSRAAPASQPCSKKPRQDSLLRGRNSSSDPVPSVYITADPDMDPNPDPGFAIILKAVLRIRIHWIHMFLSLLDPDPDPLVRGMDPDPDLDPSTTKQK